VGSGSVSEPAVGDVGGEAKVEAEGFKGRRIDGSGRQDRKRSLTLPRSHRAAVLWKEGQGEGQAKGQLQQRNVKRLFEEYINIRTKVRFRLFL